MARVHWQTESYMNTDDDLLSKDINTTRQQQRPARQLLQQRSPHRRICLASVSRRPPDAHVPLKLHRPTCVMMRVREREGRQVGRWRWVICVLIHSQKRQAENVAIFRFTTWEQIVIKSCSSFFSDALRRGVGWESSQELDSASPIPSCRVILTAQWWRREVSNGEQLVQVYGPPTGANFERLLSLWSRRPFTSRSAAVLCHINYRITSVTRHSNCDQMTVNDLFNMMILAEHNSSISNANTKATDVRRTKRNRWKRSLWNLKIRFWWRKKNSLHRTKSSLQ